MEEDGVRIACCRSSVSCLGSIDGLKRGRDGVAR